MACASPCWRTAFLRRRGVLMSTCDNCSPSSDDLICAVFGISEDETIVYDDCLRNKLWELLLAALACPPGSQKIKVGSFTFVNPTDYCACIRNLIQYVDDKIIEGECFAYVRIKVGDKRCKCRGRCNCG